MADSSPDQKNFYAEVDRARYRANWSCLLLIALAVSVVLIAFFVVLEKS